MARMLAGLAMAGAIALAPVPGLTGLAHAQGPASVADLADKLIGGVVNISTSQKVAQKRPTLPRPKAPEGSPFQDFFDELFPDQKDGNDTPRTVQSQGSGFVIDASGIIVTNNHVISDADEIVANFSDGTKLDAELVGRDPKTDLAVLRVKPEKPLTVVKFGDSDKARVGDWVMAIGNPFGFGRTVTLGIVSAIGRDINSGPYDNYIQTDASINKGNSGGPLFNMDGEVIGINSRIGEDTSFNLHVPVSVYEKGWDELVASKTFNIHSGAYLGVQGEEVAQGVRLTKIWPDEPAARAGMQTGDILLTFEGVPVESMDDLIEFVGEIEPGSSVIITLLRDGKVIEVEPRLGIREQE